jgi:hypothetical protein
MSKVSRREFVVASALASLYPGTLPAAAPEAKNPEVEARIQWIFTKYGDRLTDEQRADIRRLIASGQAGVDAMRAFPLDNSVAPATRFKVWRKK